MLIMCSPVKRLALKVLGRSFHGGHYRYRLALADGQQLACDAPLAVELVAGDELAVAADLQSAVLLPRSRP